MPPVETITVLMTDLVGSTGLETRLGPAAADELRREHFGLLRDAVGACAGDEVKTTGDGLMIVFQGAANAVRCAVAIQQGVERRNRSAEHPLAIRVGVSVGDATREGDDYFGLPVVEASRLCEHADGGQILTTELVWRIGGRDAPPFAPVGALELKGLPEPTPAFEVAWEPTPHWAHDLPLPPRLQVPSTVAYVGRVRERALAAERWEAAIAGRRQALLVAGEPGIGKTRFTVQVALELHAAGAVVLFGHCAEELGAPYGAFIGALSHLVEHAPEDALAAHVDRHGGELSRLVPALQRRIPSAPAPVETDPETERYLLFAAVVGLLAEASAESPIVVLLDDLHWADAPTLALLKHVVAEAHAARILVLATYRDTDLSRGHELTDVLADLRREDGIERLALKGLDEEAVIAFMETVAGHELDATGQSLAREITAETDGNPFFVGELLRHLAESGTVLQASDGRWDLTRKLSDLGLPQSVREVVHRRVDRLGTACRDILATAAVIGRSFELDLLARVVREDEDEVIDLLEAAVEASLLQERAEQPGTFTFAHNLINHTLYDALGSSRRARIHRRVAEALEASGGEIAGARVAELARHWTAATVPVRPGKALAYCRQAGEQALAALAPDEARGWFEQALELLDRTGADGAGDRCDVLIGLGEAERQTGRPAYRETLLDASRLAEELRDPDRAARAALANNRGFASSFGVVDTERVAALERAVELDRTSDPERCARLLAQEAMELQFDPDHEHRRDLADRALALARESGDPRILPYVLRDHFHAVWSVDTIAARHETAAEMTQLGERSTDPLARIWALDRSIHVAAESGACEEAVEAADRLLGLTDELGQPGLRWHATYYAAGLALLRGDIDEADRLAEAASRLGARAGEPDTILVYAGQIAAIRVEQGRPEEVVEMLEQAVAHNPGIPAFESGLAATLCEAGRVRDAAALVERAGEAAMGAAPRDQVYSTALATWARAVAEVGAPRPAARLYDLIEPWRDRIVWNGTTGYGAAESYLGMLAATLGSADRAADHFAAAARLYRREGMRGWEARDRCHQAAALRAAGENGSARAAAEEALAMARESARPALVRRAEALLHATADTASPR